MIRSQIFALLLTVSLFCACAPSLRTTAVRSREQRDIREMAIRQEFSTRDSLFFRALCEELLRRLDSERVRNRIIGQEIETITREYDTNRPVDTLTGKPPPSTGDDPAATPYGFYMRGEPCTTDRAPDQSRHSIRWRTYPTANPRNRGYFTAGSC